jgi:DNA polymerase III subunit gamma/tau
MSNENRTALARTWRPRRFAEMATQEHVSETLRAAVQRGRTAHAYLFCGPRGVGKTTAARVLAMALNCPDRSAEGEPCAECESCTRIWAGKTSLDVVEIDAASNRGVDDARDLRDRAMYAPTSESRYKVYIIDEAHMLTREAWNALLKILEEPPPRVIFVFATTEPQKIQQTAAPILSRCQRFDFRRITTQGIVGRLRTVLEGEGIVADDDALAAIARRAEGGMRDALSLTDQVLSFAGARVTGEDVRRVLGLVGEEMYLELFGILADRRYADVFHFVQRIIDEGYDLTEFYKGLADALRAIMITKLEGADAADVREDLKAAYSAVAELYGRGDLLRMLSMVAELDTEGRFRKSANPRTMLEALLLRWAFLERTVDVEALLRAAGGQAPGPLAEGAPDAPAAPRSSSLTSILRDLGPPQRQPAPAAAPRSAPAPAAPAAAKAPPTVAAAAPPVARRAPEAAIPAPPAAEPKPEPPKPEPKPEPDSAATPEPTPAAPAAGTTQRTADDALRTLLEQRRAPHGLGIFLKAAWIVEDAGDEVVIEVPPGPGLERLSGASPARREVQDIMSELMGRPISLAVRSGIAGPMEAPPRRAAGDEGRGAGEGAPSSPPPQASRAPRRSGRITPESVKAERLSRIARSDTTLEVAVRDWDLELMD